MRQEHIVVDGKTYSVYIYHERRKNARAAIGKTGVHIRLPHCMPREEQYKHILEMKQWVIKKIQERPPQKQKGDRIYEDGDRLNVGNEEYVLRIIHSDKQSSSGRLKGNIIALNISQNISQEVQNKHIATLLSRVIAQKRLPLLQKKVQELNEQHFGFPLGKIFFKYTTSRWGSCSEKGNINISTRLLFVPEDVLTYVCIHELAHLQEQNHSQAFWQLVGKAMPEYKEKERWLKEHGGNCWF